ncbi:unnamed protein product [Phytophthora lilii]|uniref:Unnamed protein product n=1 Tax=Phytophthora lilii TaxID=2077276 RepID=A0A9W6YET1_9STRA|nr:unnamed protein product [Phytophthora lilii]
MSLADDVDLEEFVMSKDELSGADIKAVCTEAGLLALRERPLHLPDRLGRSDEIRLGSQDVTAKLGLEVFPEGSFCTRNEEPLNRPDFFAVFELQPMTSFTSNRLARFTRFNRWLSSRTARRLVSGFCMALLVMASWTDSAQLVGSSKAWRRQLWIALAHLIMVLEVAAAKQ